MIETKRWPILDYIPSCRKGKPVYVTQNLSKTAARNLINGLKVGKKLLSGICNHIQRPLTRKEDALHIIMIFLWYISTC